MVVVRRCLSESGVGNSTDSTYQELHHASGLDSADALWKTRNLIQSGKFTVFEKDGLKYSNMNM